jgi:hypothetical protein
LEVAVEVKNSTAKFAEWGIPLKFSLNPSLKRRESRNLLPFVKGD